MSSENLKRVMAIDGGGTKTTACAAAKVAPDKRAAVVGRSRSGPTNPMHLALDVVKANLAEAIQHALNTAAFKERSVDRLLIGLAGVESAGCADHLTEWARQSFDPREVEVQSDIDLLAYGAGADDAAVVLVSGTGSIAVAREDGTTRARVGGRGYLVGDEGSGYWIGAQGVRCAIRAVDGTGESTALVAAAADHYGSPDVQEWSHRIYSADDPRSFLADSARWVLACAESGDDVAGNIVGAAARALAQLVRAAAASIEASDFDLVLAGGVLVNATLIRERLQDELRTLQLTPRSATVCPDPAAQAALRLCAD